jgi:hypothetical protein
MPDVQDPFIAVRKSNVTILDVACAALAVDLADGSDKHRSGGLRPLADGRKPGQNQSLKKSSQISRSDSFACRWPLLNPATGTAWTWQITSIAISRMRAVVEAVWALLTLLVICAYDVRSQTPKQQLRRDRSFRDQANHLAAAAARKPQTDFRRSLFTAGIAGRRSTGE